MEMIKILDHGYIKLLRVDGSDLDIELAARVSFNNEVDEITPGFIERLAGNKHMSPFRHVGILFKIKLPLSINGQYWKHVIGVSNIQDATAWNQQSNRGKRKSNEFYYPSPRQVDGKWGQGTIIEEYVDEFKNDFYEAYANFERLYSKWIDRGVAPANIRELLPHGAYTTVISKMSLEAAFHFYELRSDSHAQLEIQEYAKAIDIICSKYFPIAWNALKSAR